MSRNRASHHLLFSDGAGVGVRDGLFRLFNDNSEEAKLLAFQLDLLKKHLGVERFSNY